MALSALSLSGQHCESRAMNWNWSACVSVKYHVMCLGRDISARQHPKSEH